MLPNILKMYQQCFSRLTLSILTGFFWFFGFFFYTFVIYLINGLFSFSTMFCFSNFIKTKPSVVVLPLNHKETERLAYIVYFVQTTQVKYLPLWYGGQANDPHTALTG